MSGRRDRAGELSDEPLDGLGRLDPARRSDGLLTVTLADSARLPGFADPVAALTPSPDPIATLDMLGAASAQRFRRNVGSSAFAILHGTTVSAMASVLLVHLDAAGQQRLIAAVAGFVAAAVVGFDDQLETPNQVRHLQRPSSPSSRQRLRRTTPSS